jgi:hypothetical protein
MLSPFEVANLNKVLIPTTLVSTTSIAVKNTASLRQGLAVPAIIGIGRKICCGM